MSSLLFLSALAAFFSVVFVWGFRVLPTERWQILAAVPFAKDPQGNWKAFNLTYYGLFTASAYVHAVAMFFLLLTALGIPAEFVGILVAIVLIACVPTSRWIARIVEKKRYTFTVAGAFFVGVLILPPIIWLLDIGLAKDHGITLPTVAILAAAAIAYAFGEGIGRLACISFGCCYGKCVAESPAPWNRIFAHWYTGKSMVTEAQVSISVCHDRV